MKYPEGYKKPPYPWDLRDEMGMQLREKIQSHPTKGDWQHGNPGVGLMLNSASHYDGKLALDMVLGDTDRAIKRGVPIDIVKFALSKVCEWRAIMLETQPRKEHTTGEITMDILKTELKGKIPDGYFTQIFSE